MTVTVYGKNNCGLCESAKSKLKLMGIPFSFEMLIKYTTHHEGWRNDGSVELTSFYHGLDTLPIIKIDDKLFDYPGAMKHLRSLPKVTPAPAPSACAV